MSVSRADAEHRAALSLAFPTESPGVPTRGQPSQERWCPLRHGWLPTKLSDPHKGQVGSPRGAAGELQDAFCRLN